MTDEDLRSRLAGLIVDALEVGTGKRERDVIDELFDSFDVDFHDIDVQFPPNLPERTRLLRERAASQLADAAPTSAALLNAVVRLGGRFVAMVEEVYGRLSRHAATVSGASETFRLERGGVDEEQLTISPAFIEQVRYLVESLQTIDIGQIDEASLSRFILWDNGEPYGRWPISATSNDDMLSYAVVNLAWIPEAVRQRALVDPAWAEAGPAVEAARTAAGRLVTAAERLVQAHIAHLEVLPDTDAQTAAGLLFSGEMDEWSLRHFADELEHFRAERALGQGVPGGGPQEWVTGIDETSALGLRAHLQPVILPATSYWSGSGVSQLAAFTAMWRLGLWPPRHRDEIEDRVFADPRALTSWLDWVRTSCDEATAWLENDVLTVTAAADITGLIESIEEFLNLPLWRQRYLLYEVWVLCATLDASEQADWTVELSGLTRANGTWVLSVSPTDNPVATLRYRSDPAISLDVWREPDRATVGGVLTPDVTVSTPGRYLRDLLVVEAKDRQKMSVGRDPIREDAAAANRELRTALGVARRYANGLRPRATWVCNHCEFRQGADAAANHGDMWTRIHVAAQFRPTNVPAAFAESVQAALAPPPDARPRDDSVAARESGLILVVDVTASMGDVLDDVFASLIARPAWPSFGTFRAVLYSDHGDDEPFLVRKVGPFGDLPSLIAAVQALPSGNGHDTDEALEDAMQRCRELVDDIGPQDLLVLTDAAPHPASICPYGIDFGAETQKLLDSGSRLYVASDWLRRQDLTWNLFRGAPGFHFAPLSEILTRQASTAG